MEKIGLLGGTFDPVHHGHVELAEHALDRYGLDRVVFVPAANPPHKARVAICDISHRLHMLHLAVDHKNKFVISELELDRAKVSYTVTTLRTMRKCYPSNSSFYFVIGHEAFLDIETWYNFWEVLETTNFIVAVRPGFPIEGYLSLMARLGFARSSETGTIWLCEKFASEIHLLESDVPNISSTDVRDRLTSGLEWHSLVPSEVAAYITANHLYA